MLSCTSASAARAPPGGSGPGPPVRQIPENIKVLTVSPRLVSNLELLVILTLESELHLTQAQNSTVHPNCLAMMRSRPADHQQI